MLQPVVDGTHASLSVVDFVVGESGINAGSAHKSVCCVTSDVSFVWLSVWSPTSSLLVSCAFVAVIREFVGGVVDEGSSLLMSW